ncbi:ECF transporter S component [Glaciibacter superstes]|uniref:ECF transporter S component n=1 Tax=Glaciibacter superstes TaxID=501023 RepID=UPI0003B37D02|nr:ECF transporter S component [Glaciibacter superstes]
MSTPLSPAPNRANNTANNRTKANPFAWTLKDLVLLVVLGVVFGFLYWVFVQAWTALSILMGPAGDLAQHFLLGAWLIVAPIAVAIVRRPFAGVMAEVIASVIEVVFLGSAVGPLLFVAAALQGAGSELPFALTRYRNYSWLTYALSGLLGAGFVFFYSAFRSGWYGQDLFLIRLAIQLVSGVILGGLLAKLIVDGLVKTGVVDNFAIGRARLGDDHASR